MAQQTQNINQAAEQLTDATQQAFRTLVDRTVTLQESNLRFTQNFYKSWIEQLNNQAQGTRQAVQNLRDQGQRQREAVETLSREARNTYSEFLNSAVGFYQNAVGTATQVAQQNMQQGVQATQQSVQAGAEAASQTAQQAARGAEQVAQEGAVAAERVAPGVSIEDYDNLNVAEIVEQLENLSAEELQAARAYEQQNKDRDTLLEQIERRIKAVS